MACATGYVASATTAACTTGTTELVIATCPAVGTCPSTGLCTTARPAASSPSVCASTTCTIDECCDAAPGCPVVAVPNGAGASGAEPCGSGVTNIADGELCTMACATGYVASATTAACTT